MKAMILAAGFGTRLWPLTEDRTKPAIPFLNRPLVAYSVEYVRQHGIRDVIVNLHHAPESIRRALGDGADLGVRIEYSYEPEILGTGGALDKVRDKLGDGDFAVINGKIVTDLDLTAAFETHRRRQALATLVLKPNPERRHFTIVDCDRDGSIKRFAGFPDDEAHRNDGADAPPLMFTGIQVLSPRIFEYIPRGRFSHTTTEAYPDAIAAGEPVVGHVAHGAWRELSTLERYYEASCDAMRSRGLANIVGDESEVDVGAEVADSVLWKGVRVESGAVVRASVLGDGVRIRAGERIEHAVVVRAEIVREIERGTVRGGNLVVPLEPVLD